MKVEDRMMPGRPALRLVPGPGQVTTNHQSREQMADYLEAVVGICRAHSPWTCDGVDQEPPVGVLVVLVSADGEPTPMFAGTAWGAADRDDRIDLIHDVEAAITNRAYMGLSYEELRSRWADSDERRTKYRAQKAADAAEHERTHPFKCDCGKRCKSEAGLARHLATSPRHRGAQR